MRQSSLLGQLSALKTVLVALLCLGSEMVSMGLFLFTGRYGSIPSYGNHDPRSHLRVASLIIVTSGSSLTEASLLPKPLKKSMAETFSSSPSSVSHLYMSGIGIL